VEKANQEQKWRKKFKKQDCIVASLKSRNTLTPAWLKSRIL